MYRCPMLLLSVALVLDCGCNHAPSTNSPLAQSTTLTDSQMRADLDQYHDAICEAWAYLDSKTCDHAVDVSGTKDRLASRISPGTTRTEFGLLLKEYAAALKDGHSDVLLGSVPDLFPYSWPIGFLAVDEGVMVASLNWLAENPGIELGDILMSVNGVPTEDFLRSRMALTSASSDLARRSIAIDRLHWSAQESVRLRLSKADGSTLEADFRCLPQRINFRSRRSDIFCEHTSIEGFVKITIPSFGWNHEAFFAAANDREREEALEDAKKQIDEAFAITDQADGVILDLRDNDGGFELLSSYVAEHLVSSDFTYYELERHKADSPESYLTDHSTDARSSGARIPQIPRSWQSFQHFEGNVYNGPLVVLINEHCFSTTDNLCAFLDDVRADTTFVGRPTHGGTGQPAIVETLSNCGAQVQLCVSRVYSPKGKLVEGTGTSPDVFVGADRESTLARRDRMLETALEILRTRKDTK